MAAVSLARGFFLTAILLLCFTVYSDARGRSGGYRGGYSGSSYSYRSSATRYGYYRSSTYRASTYRSTSYRAYYRAPYRSYRTYYYRIYRSSVPVRYSRAYFGFRGYYYYYYNAYFYYRPGAVGYRSSRTSGAAICKNYEANANGTALGTFSCPLPFEPSEFSYCCGETNTEYCCKFIDNPGNLAGVIVGCIIAVIAIGLIIFCIWKCNSKPKVSVGPSAYQTQVVQTTTTSGMAIRNPRPQVRQQPPIQMTAYGNNYNQYPAGAPGPAPFPGQGAPPPYPAGTKAAPYPYAPPTTQPPYGPPTTQPFTYPGPGTNTAPPMPYQPPPNQPPPAYQPPSY